jgi:hypothetical protein
MQLHSLHRIACEAALADKVMHPPKRMTLAETQAHISEFFSLRCCRASPNSIVCARCEGEIGRVRAYMALHDESFGDSCVGPARAWRMEIPYCKSCEEPPSRYGFIHMSDAELNLPSVIEGSRPFPASPAKLAQSS